MRTKIFKRARRLGLTVFALGTLALIGGFIYLETEVPDLSSASNYAPPQVTHVYADDGELVGEFFTERRTVVPIGQIPLHVQHAFLAAEDANFYQHEGIDYLGLLRAALKNLRPGAHLQGASTITQQTVKTLILGPERSYLRKMREAILSREMEQLLTKDEILYLYLNQIYFGSGCYGIEEAARTYFGKSVHDVDLGEAALLASIPKNPSHYTPAADPNAAKQRQKYVLDQMVANAWATPEEAKAAYERTVAPPPRPPAYLNAGPHYLEHTKRVLIEKYGEKQVLEGGLKVYTGMKGRMQAAAHTAVRAGLVAFTKNNGWGGPRVRIEVDRLARAQKVLHDAFDAKLKKLEDRLPLGQTLAWDLSALTSESLSDDEKLAGTVRTVPLIAFQRTTGIVDAVDSVADEVWVDLGSSRARLPFAAMSWARRVGANGPGPAPRDPTDVVRLGDVVTVDIVDVPTQTKRGKRIITADLVPDPKAEAALVAIDPHTRLVRAMVGGYRSDAGGLNRAIQSHRQPGSAFKPLLYATGINAGAITPASLCADSPVVIRDPWTGQAWKPENYEDGRYDGTITYRTALMRSKNTCSVKLIEKIGFEQVITLARAAGIESELPKNSTLALGTGDLTPLELTNAYSTVASGGYFAPPVFVRKVVDLHGQVLEETLSQPTQVLRPAVAYVLTQMMRSVVEEGTATKALVLDRPLAGKTGTSNQSRNVWFAGFSAELVAAVWVGYDDNSPMGHATGGSTALPIWIDFMGRSLAGTPVREFVPPSDVVFVRVDADTGEPTDDLGSIEEAFIAGTEPSKATQALPSIYMQDDPHPPN